MVTPRLTVLMPVYNAERFIKEAIDSILDQSFEHFEFIIIDDGSNDNSCSIIQSYGDSRIRFYKNAKNIGISATLNKGIALSSCDLIARMDSDDICHRDRLKMQYKYMTTNSHCALLSTWAEVTTDDNEFVRLEKYRNEFYYYNLTFECWIYHPTVMFRKQCVESVGGYTMMYSEDFDLFWKLSIKYRIGNIAEPLVKYRLSPTSLNTVLRKAEYDKANEANVIRNIKYYMGDDYKLSKPALECLRHNFNLILESRNIHPAIEALNALDEITEKILERPNPNRNAQSIREASFYKRRFIVTELARRLPVVKAFALLSQLGEWITIYYLGFDFLRWQIKKVKSFLMM
jgi:glycosyltransferase involved in cell wall biosynthesis